MKQRLKLDYPGANIFQLIDQGDLSNDAIEFYITELEESSES
jgi:hypothetical protein